MTQKITIQDVARAANVSPSMVSRVVNNLSSVKPEAARKVRKIIKELGYTPSKRGRSFHKNGKSTPKRTRRIAFLKCDDYDDGFEYSIYMKVLNSVEKALSNNNQTMVLRHFNTNNQLPKQIFQSKVDGVILLAHLKDEKKIRTIQQYPCCEIMGEVNNIVPWDHVTYNNSMIGTLAANYLLDHDHMNCGMITEVGSGPGIWDTRCTEFKNAVQAAGGKVFEFPLDRKSVEEWNCPIDKIMAKLNDMTGFFVYGDEITASLYRQFQAKGISPGIDLEIVSCDNHPFFLRGLMPRPASIDIQLEAIGRRAVQQLLWRIDNPTEPRVKIELDVSINSESHN